MKKKHNKNRSLSLQMAKTKRDSLRLRRDIAVLKNEDKGFMRDEIEIKITDKFKAKGTTRSITWFLVLGTGVGLLTYAVALYIKGKLGNKTSGNGIIPRPIRCGNQGTQTLQGLEVEKENEKESDNTTEVLNWSEYFDSEFPLRLLTAPPIIEDYFTFCPRGFEVAVIMSLTAELALCFSMVQAKYLDKKYHRPNIMTIIEGLFGSGKGIIKQMHDSLFSRRIERDMSKLSTSDGKRHIIQTIAPNITAPALADILANNQGVHAIVTDPEARTLVNAMKQSNSGITPELIRKSYDNDSHSRMNYTKNAPQGIFTVALNFVITGTPGDTEALLGKEHEGGTSSRMALCVIPPRGKELPTFEMPEDHLLTSIQNKLDDWTAKFSYFTDSEGNDIPAPIHQIDLEYVCTVLKEWIEGQYKLGEYENNQARMDLRTRIASTVFNSSIVWHMLYGEPTARERAKRKCITDLCLYMANYLMERWLHKYGKQHNAERAKFTAEEMVSVRRAPKPGNQNTAAQLPGDGLERGRIMWDINQREKLSYDKIGELYGLTKDQVSGYIRRYREKNALRPDTDVVE